MLPCRPDAYNSLHVLPYQGPRSDSVALSFKRMQKSSHICVYEGNPITCWTLMSVRTCCHDVRMDATLNYSNLLDTDGCPDDITTSSGRMLLTDEHPDTLLDHPNRNKGSDLSKLEFTQNLPWTLNNLLPACDTGTCHNKAHSIFEK